MNDASDGWRELRERRRSAHDEGFRRVAEEPPVVHLAVRQVDLRLAVPLESAYTNVGTDADNRAIFGREVEAAAERILPWPVALDERVADHRHHLRLHGIGVADIAPGPERNA